jgi:hypothetical protein
MAYKSAIVVLVGSQTASRRWVRHEIVYAWDNRKPIVGIRIHALADQGNQTDIPGANPFSFVALEGGGTVADYVPLIFPRGRNSREIYADIKANMKAWVTLAYKRP